jgi:NADPH:quinone reductase-like Zn-dependent oxidoreductase
LGRQYGVMTGISVMVEAVLRATEHPLGESEGPVPDPGPGEVRVRIHRSGVNPTDWKSRRGER